MKWGWEFDNKTGAHPVQVIEYCSLHKQALSSTGKNDFTTRYRAPTKNTYNGLPCDGKNHGTLVGDQFVIKFVASVLKSGTNSKLSPEILALTNENLANLKNVCPGLHAPQKEKFLLQYGINPENNPTDDRWLITKGVDTVKGLASTGVGVAKTLGVVAGNAAYKTFGFLKNAAASYFFSTPSVNLLSKIDQSTKRRFGRYHRRYRRKILYHL